MSTGKELKDMTEKELIAEIEKRGREQCAHEDEALQVSKRLVETMMELTMALRGVQLDPKACCGDCGVACSIAADLTAVECRKRAPKMLLAGAPGLNGGRKPMAVFPIMQREDKACGDWAPKQEV